MNLTNKVLKSAFRFVGGTFLAASLFLGSKGDYYKYSKVRDVLPNEQCVMSYVPTKSKAPQMSYFTGLIMNPEDLTQGEREKVGMYYEKSDIFYQTSILGAMNACMLGLLLPTFLDEKEKGED